MIRISLALCLFSLGLSLSAQESYPRWFMEAQPSGWVSVFSTSEEEAVSDGARVLAAYEQCFVIGDIQQFQDAAVDDQTWKKTDYQVVFDERRADLLRKDLKVWARIPIHLLAGDQLYLVGPKRPERQIDSRFLESGSAPAWTKNVGTLEGRAWGIGRFTLQGRTADAWVKAEEQALFQLLTTQQLQLGQWKGVRRDGGGEDLSTLNWVRLQYLVSKIRVEGRWYDAEHDNAVVAVTAPVSGIGLLGPQRSK